MTDSPVVQGRHRRRGAEGSRHPSAPHFPVAGAVGVTRARPPSARPSSARRSTTSRPSSAASRPTPTSPSRRWASSRTAGRSSGWSRTTHYSNVANAATATAVRAAGFPRRWRRPHARHPARRRARALRAARRRRRRSPRGGRRARRRRGVQQLGSRNGGRRRGSVCARRRHGATLRVDNGLGSRPCCSRPPTSPPTSPTPRPPGRRCHQRGDRRRRATTPGGIVRLASDTEGHREPHAGHGRHGQRGARVPRRRLGRRRQRRKPARRRGRRGEGRRRAAIPTVTVDAGVGGVLDITPSRPARAPASGPPAATAARVRLDNALPLREARPQAPPTPCASRARTLAPTRTAWRPVRNATNGSPARSICSSWDGAYRESFPEPLDDPSDGRYVRLYRRRRAQRLRVRARHRPTPSWALPSPPPQTVALAGGQRRPRGARRQ